MLTSSVDICWRHYFVSNKNISKIQNNNNNNNDRNNNKNS